MADFVPGSLSLRLRLQLQQASLLVETQQAQLWELQLLFEFYFEARLLHFYGWLLLCADFSARHFNHLAFVNFAIFFRGNFI